jgi:tetraacyldisaccharide 4'-kinase
VDGIKNLLPEHDLILLDDAFQHRAVEAGLSILLFDYSRVNEPHLLLPAGNLREPFSGRWRAQIIIITKCAPQLTTEEQQRILNKIDPLPYQQSFFTSIAYQGLQHVGSEPVDQEIDNDTTVFLLTGIANAEPLVKHLYSSTSHIIHHKYPDHHQFTTKNIAKLAGEFEACTSQKKIIITTEKDARRLEKRWLDPELPHAGKLPVCVIPIKMEFLNGSGLLFDQLIIDYVRTHTTNNRVH